MSVIVEFLEGKSLLHRLDPRSKMLMWGAFTVGIVLISDPIVCLALLVPFVVWTAASGIPLKTAFSVYVRVYSLIILYGVVSLFLSNANLAAAKDPANIVVYLDPIHKWLPVTNQGIIWDVAMVIRFIFIIYVLQLIMFTTPMVDLVLGLAKWRVPAKAALAMSIALGFVPVFAIAISTIMDAQKCRGWKGFESGSPVDKIKALPVLFTPVVMNAITRAQQISVAIESRGFGHNIEKRTWTRELKFSAADYVVNAISIIFFVATNVLTSMGYGTYQLTYSLLFRS